MESRRPTFHETGERLRALDAFPLIVAGLLAVKVLMVRRLVLGHAFGTGLIADVLFLIAVSALAATVKGRAGRALLALVSIFTSVVLFSIAIYASFFEQLPTPQLLFMARQVRLGDDVMGLVTLKSLLLLADIPYVLWRASRPTGTPLRPSAVRVVVALTLPVAVLLTLVTALVGTGTDALSVSYRLGLVPFETASLFGGSLESEAEAVSLQPDIQAQIDALTGHIDGGRLASAPEAGQYAGKSVIVIQMEALQAGLIGARYEGVPIVPHLEALVAKSHYFPNTYSQIGRGNTSDAEFIVNTSLLPPVDQPASVAYAAKEIPGLPRLLAQRGYTTATFHTNTADFWNRFQLYPALGFGAFCDRAFFGDRDVTGYGPSDRILYEKVIPPLVAEAREGRPFYAHIVTLSAHYPFRPAAGRSRLQLPPDVADTTTGRYLRAQAYADAQLGWFMSQLESYGLLDECIVVVYGDHFGLRWEDQTAKDAVIRRDLYGHGYNRADFYNVPLIVHLPKQQEGMVTETVLGHVDVMPTLADLLGLDLQDVPHFGRSAFVDTPTRLTRPGAMAMSIDDRLLYLKGINGKEDRFYLSKTQQKLAVTEPASEAYEAAAQQLRLSAEYAEGLPERKGAAKKVGYIPNPGKDFR